VEHRPVAAFIPNTRCSWLLQKSEVTMLQVAVEDLKLVLAKDLQLSLLQKM